MTGDDVINYFLKNPPFEITDKTKYASFLIFQSEMTMVELSENKPAISENTFTTAAALGEETVISHLLTDIDAKLMELIIIQDTASMAQTFQNISYTNNNNFGMLSSGAVAAAMRSHSIINLLAVNEYTNIIQEWYKPIVTKMVFDNESIKLTPDTEYYALYTRYREVSSLQLSEIRTFQRLFEMNVMLAIYQSDIFAAEGGIRSVSLSGLSVSFNVPEAAKKVTDLKKEKSSLLSSIALDYGDDCVGLI